MIYYRQHQPWSQRVACHSSAFFLFPSSRFHLESFCAIHPKPPRVKQKEKVYQFSFFFLIIIMHQFMAGNHVK